MKRVYSKPDIMFEDFSLSTSIAAGCEFSTNFAMDSCGFKYGPYVIFMDGIYGCEIPVPEGDPMFNGVCYHNPSDDKNIFSS